MNFITTFALWITIIECTLPIISTLGYIAVKELDSNSLENPQEQEISTDENFEKCSSTPLHLAMGLLRLLVNQGADLQAIDCEGMTPHDLAVKTNIQEIIQLTYSEKKMDMNKSGLEYCRSSPLHHVIHSITGLIDQGASLQTLDCQHLTPPDIATLTSGGLMLAITYNAKTISICNRTALHSAIISKHIESLSQLLKTKENMYAVDCEGMTPMDLAIRDNNHEAIIALVDAQYDVNRRFTGKQSLLLQGISVGNLQTIKLLVDLGINDDVLKTEGSSLLFKALLYNKTDIAQFLIGHGVKLDYQNEIGDTYIHKFSEEGITRALIVIRKLNLLNAKLINSMNKKNESALSKAVRGNYPAIVNILLTSGADASKFVEDGKTYLHIAIKNKSRDALLALLENGLPVDSQDSSGISPILFAVREDDTESMDILKEFGSNLNQNFGNNSNLLHQAAFSGSTKALTWLLHNGHSVDEKGNDDFTALHHAARFGKVQIVKELISQNANVSAETIYKDTPLHWASVNGNFTIIKDLILKGVDVNAKQKNGWTPLHLTAYYGHLPAVKELISNGADVNPLNQDRHTPLHYSITRNYTNTADYIKSKGGINK